MCRNLASLTSTNFTGGEGDGHFQHLTKILFAWKMSGATRSEWGKQTAGFSLALWAGRAWEMESWSHRCHFFFWGSNSVKKPLLLSFSSVWGKRGAVSLEKREGPWTSYYFSSWEAHSFLLVSFFFFLHALFIPCLVSWMEQERWAGEHECGCSTYVFLGPHRIKSKSYLPASLGFVFLFLTFSIHLA